MRLPSFSFYSSRAVWVVLAVMLLALLYNLGDWGVLETSEARYAEISREMLASGDWLHPRLLGILHYHKPPVTYMISSAGMAVFGINSFGVRFFLQISLLIQGVLVYRLGK
ncbi:MAG TPA: phospholipid carrier-dependent glycosyltransferase, partial [Pontibacter sp.]